MMAVVGPGRPIPRKYLSYNEDGNSTLHRACYLGDYKLALMLLLTPNVDTEVRNVWRETPLHQCTSQGHLEIMLLLLDGGAHVNALDKDSYTPLHHALIHGNREATELLLCYGARVHNDPCAMVGLSGHSLPKSPLELASSVHVCHSAVEKAQGRVWSLQHFCRLAIRKFLGVGKRKRIKELPLPRNRISYLMSLPVEFTDRLHDSWLRVRVSGSSNTRHRSKRHKDGTVFSNGASLQALKRQ